MKLTLTRDQAYQRKQTIWEAWVQWQKRIVRAFFPDTGGIELYMHNWYSCAEKSNPKGAKLADWVKQSTWDRWHRLERQFEKRDCEREHLRHGKHFRPLWCPLCQKKSVKA